jgi:hypothetical protein
MMQRLRLADWFSTGLPFGWALASLMNGIK